MIRNISRIEINAIKTQKEEKMKLKDFTVNKTKKKRNEKKWEEMKRNEKKWEEMKRNEKKWKEMKRNERMKLIKIY